MIILPHKRLVNREQHSFPIVLFVWRRHVCVLFRGTNLAAGNQQKDLFWGFPNYA